MAVRWQGGEVASGKAIRWSGREVVRLRGGYEAVSVTCETSTCFLGRGFPSTGWSAALMYLVYGNFMIW